MEYEKVLPTDCKFGKDMEGNKGLIIAQNKSSKVISNAITQVVKCYSEKDFRRGGESKKIAIYYIDADGEKIGDIQIFDEEEIRNLKFIQKRPIGVIISPRCQTKVSEIYCYCIQKQLVNLPSTEKFIGSGWYNKKYYWQNSDKTYHKNDSYFSVLLIAKLLDKKNIVICAALLAAIHGPIKEIMMSAGIDHDFVTVIAGKSGIGKSSIVKILCDYQPNVWRSLSLESNRKEVERFLEEQFDTTVVIDDFCTTASDRIHKQQLQTLSRIIQLVDGAKVLVDENSKHTVSGNAHFIVTCEMLINNISTLNRCFVIMMDEPLQQKVWDQLEKIRVTGIMFDFMQYLTAYLQTNYDKIHEWVKNVYDSYLSDAPSNLLSNDTSRNRIITTRAILLTLKDILLSFFRDQRISLRLMESVETALEESIRAGIASVTNQIEGMHNEMNYMRYLPTLEYIFTSREYEQNYYFASNEEAYIKKRRRLDKGCIGFYNADDSDAYISFEPSVMCEVLKENGADADITPKKLGKELRHYGLAYIDSQGKLCSYWHTKKKYYHVNKNALREHMREIYGIEI